MYTYIYIYMNICMYIIHIYHIYYIYIYDIKTVKIGKSQIVLYIYKTIRDLPSFFKKKKV